MRESLGHLERQQRQRRNDMRKSLATLAGAAALTLALNGAWAQDKVIKFGFAQDFTKVYTFVSSEYSQGQRDYLSLINARGGVKGYRLEATVIDHGNERVDASTWLPMSEKGASGAK